MITKGRRNFISIFIITAMLVGGLFVGFAADVGGVLAASKPKINAKSVSLNVGKSLQLKVTGTKSKVKWSSSSKKVATVTASGKITAKKKGTVIIKAKVKGKTLRCKVTVKIPPPVYGSRENPAYASAGVTVDLIHGKVTYKLTGLYRDAAAIQQLTKMGNWDGYDEDAMAEHAGKTLTLFVWDVKTTGGFTHKPLLGDDLIHPWTLFDYDFNQAIGPFETNYLRNKNGTKDRANLSIKGIGSSKMYMTLYLPPELDAFSTRLHARGNRDFWVRYQF
jgi:hypothetical protein